MVVVLTFLSSFIPVQGLLINEYIYGFLGNLSIPTVMLFVVHSASIIHGKHLSLAEKGTAFQLIFWTGCFLFPFTLGIDIYDPYALGYNPLGLGIALLIAVMFSWLLENYVIMAAILLSITFYTLNISESRNLWDYIIDPLIFIFAIFWLLYRVLFIRVEKQS
ncbi:MAG: hypothetical protein HN790_06330 [Methylococcales bacterium]|nr:hypothetical protein [Methylococcales bacterium]